jgi:hypothetical protein
MKASLSYKIKKKMMNQSFLHTYMKKIKNNKFDKIIYKIKNRCFMFMKY